MAKGKENRKAKKIKKAESEEVKKKEVKHAVKKGY